MPREHDPGRRLPDETVALVLRRAAELEARRTALDGALTAADVEQVAVEAGISVDAVRHALAELHTDANPPFGHVHDRPAAGAGHQLQVQRAVGRLPDRLRDRRRVRHQLGRLAALLRDDEQLLDLAHGWQGDWESTSPRRGLLAVTDQRLLFVTRSDVRDVPRDRVLGVTTSAGPWSSDRLVVRAEAGGLDIWAVTPREAVERLGELVRRLAHVGHRQSASAVEPSGLDALRRLGELRVQGILTEEEFAAEKARILSQD